MAPHITTSEARDALAMVERGRRRVLDEFDMPRWYWWGLALGWIALAAIAAFGGALTAAYLLRLLRRVTHGPAARSVTGISGVTAAERLAWSPLVLLALVLGLVPALVSGVVSL